MAAAALSTSTCCYGLPFAGERTSMKHRVLIIEDNEMLRTGLSKLVQMHGHETITAGTIGQGLQHLSSGPSHLLLDMNLPDGRGTTVLGRIRSEKLPIKVAVISGSVDAAL